MHYVVIYCICPGCSPVPVLLVIRLIVPLEARRFRLAKIVLLWEYTTLIQGILQQGQNQHREKKLVSPPPVSKNRGIWCPSFSFEVYFYIPVDMSFHLYFLALTCVFDISLCLGKRRDTRFCVFVEWVCVCVWDSCRWTGRDQNVSVPRTGQVTQNICHPTM